MLKSLVALLCLVSVLTSVVSPLQAQPADPRDRGPGGHQEPGPHGPTPQHGPSAPVPPERMRQYRGVPVMRPHGHWYLGYGRFYGDAEAYQWLAFTAITLRVLDMMSEAQQRAHEAAQIRATTAPLGQRIVWNDSGASGAVTALRDGTDSTGQYCREFQQDVTVGGTVERAYGTACRQPDGAWKIVSTGN